MKKIRCIPPITSTGRPKVLNHSARLAGLANISIGRYMSERKIREEKDNSDWDISKHSKSEFNKQKNTPIVSSVVPDQKMECVFDMFENEKDFTIVLQFNGLNLLNDTFSKLDDTCYFIPIDYKERGSYLYLRTIGDIFEYEAILGTYRLLGDEAYIPKLLQIYDSKSMSIKLKNNCVTVTYKKIEK